MDERRAALIGIVLSSVSVAVSSVAVWFAGHGVGWW